MHISGALSLTLPLLASSVAAGKSSGCGKPLPSGISTSETNLVSFRTSKGVHRTYRLHLPKKYQSGTTHPLIFSFHGRGKNDSNQESLDQFGDSDVHAIVVYPDGTKVETDSGDKRIWQGDPDATAEMDDVAFTMELANDITSKYCVDEQKLFAAGKSNGGGFAVNQLACDAGATKRFAAVAGVSAAYYQGTSDANCHPDTVPIPCSPARRPFPVFEIHGQKDDTIHYEGGKRRDRCVPSAPHFITSWAERNGLGSKNSSYRHFDGHGDLTKFTWGSHNETMHFAVTDMEHAWPRKNGPSPDGQVIGWDATPYILDFFNNNPLP